ncbi:endothelin-converting enzyme homolog [Eurosta solidaginis]|uniref:endothelin-converting enzyme homolog n=1 Tax=Eurosta solidaginis TaxID=178769 RepID=UPI0035311159
MLIKCTTLWRSILFLFWMVAATKGDEQNEPIIMRKRNEVPRYMNFHADPCLDFYEFACGNWEQPYVQTRHAQPSIEDLEVYMRTMVDHDLRNMLDEQTKLEDGMNGRKLKDFYKSCTLAERNGVAQQEYFSRIIESHGGFPAVAGSNWHMQSHNYDWQDVVGNLRFQYGMNILVGVKIEANYLYPMEDSIYLGEPDTIIPEELCSVEGTNKTHIRAEEYAIIENEVAENLNIWLSLDMEEAQKVATALVAFEYELCKGMQQQRYTKQPMFVWQSYNSNIRKTLFDFTHHFDKKIDFISATFGAQIHKPVYMTAEPYFRQLIRTLATTNKTTIANYIMYQTLSALSFPRNDQPSKREFFCLEKAKSYFPKVLGEMYMRNRVNIATRDDVVNMFDKLKESFRMNLQKPWIDDYTRHIAESKLAEMRLLFPEYNKMEISNININRSNYWTNLDILMKDRQEAQFQRIFPPARKNLYNNVESYDAQIVYRAQHTRFEMGWGLLQDPLYHINYPNSVRYAVIGQKLSSMLANAFDDISWSTTINGTLNWDFKIMHAYRNRSECFRQQISNYLHNDPLLFSNATQLREIIAQSSGLNVAFNAYLNWLALLQPTDDFEILTKETLPELNFTNTQLFFIAFAQMHCKAGGAMSRKFGGGTSAAHKLSPRERHSIARFAVNGPLRNFIEFARDFGCGMGVEMNPPDKCVIY